MGTPACLPHSGRNYTGTTGSVYGWGKTDECSTEIHPILQEVNLEVISDDACRKASATHRMLKDGVCVLNETSYSSMISEEMLCATASGQLPRRQWWTIHCEGAWQAQSCGCC